MRIGNTILIVVLTLGLLATATVFALRGSPSQPEGPTVEMLIVQLADGNEQVSRNAERALLDLGTDAIPYLDRATKSADPLLAARARRLLEDLVHPSTGLE